MGKKIVTEVSSDNGSFGVYIEDTNKNYTLLMNGFSNTIECERWMKKNVQKFKDHSSKNFAIMSLKKNFSLRVEVKQTVHIELPKTEKVEETNE